MDIKQARCTSCGASLEINGRPSTLKCDYCQNHIVLSHAIHLASQDIEKIDDIANVREHLATAVHQNNIDDILTYAQLLKNWLPDDVEAGYFYAYAKAMRSQPSYMEAFLKKPPLATEISLDKISQHLIQRSDLRDKELIELYLKSYYPRVLEKYLKVYEQRYHQEDQYATIPRDVFICHSSKQKDIAEKLVEVVEEEGHSAWISTRNLRPQDSDNYWNNIEDAIKRSKLLLVVSSKEAMISKDVQREIELAKKHQKTLIEFKTDDSPHTMFIKHAFDGIKWIEGSFDLNQNYKQIKKRVFEAINIYQENLNPPQQRRSKKFVLIALSFGILVFASLLGIFGAELRETIFPSPSVPVIIGANDISIFANQSFNPLSGINVQDETDGNLTAKLEIIGNQAFNQPGTYYLTYRVTNSQGQTKEIERQIIVNPASIPQLRGLNDLTILQGEAFNPLTGITATDTKDGNLTSQIQVIGVVNTLIPGSYNLTYKVTNSMGETIEIERQVTVIRVTTPILSGVQDVSIDLGSSFNPREGVSATDETDGDLTSTIQISGTVNSSEAGTYTLTYRITNSQGQTEQVIRRITVSTSVRYTVTFNSLGGSNVPSQQIEDGARLVLPQIAKSGHTLLGWYISFNNGETFDERWNFNSNTVSNDLTLYARWQINTYSIQLNVSGGDPITSISQTYQSEITSLPNPTKEGHTFIDWFQDPSLTVPFELPFIFTENAQAYAKWEINSYTVSFDTHGGDEIDSVSYIYKTSLELPEPIKEGHSFKGWYLDSNFIEAIRLPYEIKNNLSLHAKWEINIYRVSLKLGENDYLDDEFLSFGEPLFINQKISYQDNEIFSGWYFDSDFNNRVTEINSMPSEDILLYAKWTIPPIDLWMANNEHDYNEITEFPNFSSSRRRYETSYYGTGEFTQRTYFLINSKKNTVNVNIAPVFPLASPTVKNCTSFGNRFVLINEFRQIISSKSIAYTTRSELNFEINNLEPGLYFIFIGPSCHNRWDIEIIINDEIRKILYR
jgi:hypothetical protein